MFTTTLGGAELIDSSLGHSSEPTIYGSGTAHDTCYNAHYKRGDRTSKNEDGDKQGKPGLGVSKAIEKSGDLISSKNEIKLLDYNTKNAYKLLIPATIPVDQ